MLENTIVYIVKISSANNLEAVHPYYSGSNPFIEMKLTPNDLYYGEQSQKTSYKPLTTHPEWIPQERFLFYSTSNQSNNTNNNSQIQFTV